MTIAQPPPGSKKIAWLILLCSAGLIAIWPLPGTIAIRHCLLGVGFLASLYYLSGSNACIFQRSAWPIWMLLTFYVWLAIHLTFFSREWELQLAELTSLWMRSFLAMPLGAGLGLILSELKKKPEYQLKKNVLEISSDVATLIFLIGLSGTFIVFFSRYLFQVHISHQWIHFPFFEIPYKAKTPFVIGTALLLPLCFVLLLKSLQSQLNKWWIIPAILGVALTLFGDYFANTKNGMAIFVICFLVFLANYFLSFHWSAKKIFLGIPILFLLILFSAYGINQHIKRNAAWSNLTADISIAKNIDQFNWWKDDKICCAPTNANGVPVDGSTYQRTAWFVAGSQLLIENPLGYGLVHHSFGALARLKWEGFPEPIGLTRGATHSAWLDFALAVGIPGLLLVLIPLWVSWWRALHREGLWYSYASWTIPVISFAYLTTESNEAHFIELLFFMAAFFCGLTLNSYPPKNKTQ